MKNNARTSRNAAESKSTLLRQLIASTIALAIMGLGAWSLLGQQAPYHPDIYENEVSRGAGFGLSGAGDSN